MIDYIYKTKVAPTSLYPTSNLWMILVLYPPQRMECHYEWYDATHYYYAHTTYNYM